MTSDFDFLLKVPCIKGLSWTHTVIATIFIVTRGENEIEKGRKKNTEL